jgi:type III restriction enzyme
MTNSIIAYDRELPEITGRCAWERPDCFLLKDVGAKGGWRIDDSGRRPSKMLLVNKLRIAVDQWRDAGYPGASDVTRRLFSYWFDEDHDVPGFSVPFRYYFGQREAIETLAYIVEVAGIKDAKKLVDAFAEIFKKDLLDYNLIHETTMDGKRRLRRYFPELEADGVQELPPENLSRYAFKMATGSGKTWVMAMAIVWSYFHKKKVKGSPLSTNFLIVAPNIIVYQRLERDFAGNKIFNELPLVPPEWRPWTQKVILRGDSIEPDASGNLFLTNIQQIYEIRDKQWTPANAVDQLLGPKPVKDLSSYQRSMLERLKDLKNLVVLNDEAHHVHDAELSWSKSLLSLHDSLPKGLALWLDFSATPKDQNGMYYPWTIVDYPLAQAIEDRIIKAPIIVTKEDDPKRPAKDPDNVTKENATEKYGFWIKAAVQRWKEHYDTYKKIGAKPVLFIMAEKNNIADVIGEYLSKTPEFKLKKSEVLVIHTDETGEITKKDLEKAREAARDIDKPDNKYKVIVSVMMLREGWDVKNVTVALGLRPFTAKAEILPEQVIGRGLRLMTNIGPDTQTLEVLGTRNLLEVLRTKLEAEGVGVGSTKGDPVRPVIIEAVAEKASYDIAIPLTKPLLSHDFKKLSSLDVAILDAIYDQTELAEVYRVTLKMEFATTETEVHQAELNADIPIAQTLLSSIATKVMRRAGLSNVFSDIYPIVQEYISTKCFGKMADLEDMAIRSHLMRLDLQEGIAKYLARKLSELTVERRQIEFDKADFKLSKTKPFQWRRNLPPLFAGKTVFNFVATYNDFERRFGQFLEDAQDVLRFASLGTTEQGESGTLFRVDYLKPSGAIGFYHPDWVAVQKTKQGEINWIIETKGRVWEGTEAKDEAISDWCARITKRSSQEWRFKRVDQRDFDKKKPKMLDSLVTAEKGLF